MSRTHDSKTTLNPNPPAQVERAIAQPSTLFGLLNIYKPIGMTSHDAVAILRRVTKIKQIGHTGTLDPFAQGVLPIAIGKATRLIEFLDDDKEYLAEVSFGKTTDSYDCDGNTISETKSNVTVKQIESELEKFKGEISQLPPIYSAIKVNGKKLYEYAREGKEVEIKPRKVFIEKIELKSFDGAAQKAKISIKCSKGTYIRSIAHDLGQNLGCGAHLSELIRTQAGKFLVEKTCSLDELKIPQDVEKHLIDPLEMINLPKIEIDELEERKISMGQFIPNRSNLKEDDFLILVYNNNVKAIAQIKDNLIKAKKVF